MQGAGLEVLGIEPDSTYAEIGERVNHFTINPKFYEEVSWPENYFDLVASFHVLNQVISPCNFLIKIKRELRSGGVLYLEVPCIEYPSGGDLESFFWSTHLQTFSKNSLRRLLNQVGFRVIKNGFNNEYLWVLAENIEEPSESPSTYPFDNSKLIMSRTHKHYEEFLLKKTANQPKTLSQKISYFSRLAIVKFYNQPQAILPIIFHRMKSFGNRYFQPTKLQTLKLFPTRFPLAHMGIHSSENAGILYYSKGYANCMIEGLALFNGS